MHPDRVSLRLTPSRNCLRYACQFRPPSRATTCTHLFDHRHQAQCAAVPRDPHPEVPGTKHRPRHAEGANVVPGLEGRGSRPESPRPSRPGAKPAFAAGQVFPISCKTLVGAGHLRMRAFCAASRKPLVSWAHLRKCVNPVASRGRFESEPVVARRKQLRMSISANVFQNTRRISGLTSIVRYRKFVARPEPPHRTRVFPRSAINVGNIRFR
jgi:hypothetical protein